jgi:mRNA export factor
MSVLNAFSASTSQQGAANGDVHVEMADPPTDSVSSISFSPQANFLAVGSWDNSVGACLIVLLAMPTFDLKGKGL